MRRLSSIVFVCVLPCIDSAGELQNIEVGGKIEIYGAWYSDIYEPGEPAVRIPSWWLPHRSIGPNGTLSCIRADDGNRMAFLEQRTRLHVRADFTLEVTAFIEWDAIHTWGDHFRSDYVTGADRRGDSSDDMELHQGYIEVGELFGLPIQLRIGRQEMEFGSGWLVGADPGPDPFVGLSFDAVRLTITREPFVVDAWWSKLADRSPLEQDGDIDFLGLYATFQRNNSQMGSKGFGSFESDLYWMYLRDARSWSDTNGPALFEWLENLSGFDDYGVTHLHTVGARSAGTWDAWDWEIEAAYQFGEADAVGFLFRPIDGVYGDARARFHSWAGHAELGYTFPKSWTPRAFVGAACYGGQDRRGISFREWLNPFAAGAASVSFNRLFSAWREDNFLCCSAMSNFWKAYFGVAASPTPAVEVTANLAYLEALHAFDAPLFIQIGRSRLPLAPCLPFLTTELSTDLGWQATMQAVYQYSDDLSFEVGWSHFFVGDAIGDGAVFVDENGLTNLGGRSKKAADYLYFFTTVQF